MKSILHLKEDTEYQIPLREKDGRVKVGANGANPKVVVKKEDQQNSEASKEKFIATQSQGGPTAKKETDEITPEEVEGKEEVNNENDPALDNLEDETQNPENNDNDTITESVPPADTAKAALDEMKKLASQEGVIHPSLFISNFSKILGLMERAMQLQVKESGSATEESGSVIKEAPKATEQAETTEQAEAPVEG